MKKISFLLIIFLSIFIVSCSYKVEVKERIFISSVGLDYDEVTKEFEVIGFSPNLYKVSNQLGVSTESEKSIVRKKAKSIFIAMKKIDESIPLHVDFNHVKSLILSKNFIKDKKNIEKILQLFLNSNELHLGVHVFFTEDNILELFNGGLPDDTSLLYNLITNPDSKSLKMGKLYKLLISSLGENFYLKVSNVIFPSIGINKKVWSDDKKSDIKVVCFKGLATYNKLGEVVIINTEDFFGLNLIENKAEIPIEIEENVYLLTNYKIDKNIDKEKCVLNISFNVEKRMVENEENNVVIVKNVVKKIEELVIYIKNNGVDLFRIKEYLYRNHKDYENFDLKNYEFNYKVKIK